MNARKPVFVPWAVALGVALAAATSGRGQTPPPPPPISPGVQAQAPAGDVNALTHEMAERVRHLGEDIASDLGKTPAGPHLIRDTQELAQAVDEFHATLHNRPSAFQMRRSYSGIDATWHHLRGQLGARGASSPAVDRAAARVDQLDGQLHQALGLNALPPDYYTAAAAPPAGIGRTRRLAHALVDRAEGLAQAIQAGMAGDPNAAALAADAQGLAREADAWHDALDANASIPAAAQAFGPVDVIADRIERYVTTRSVPAPVTSAWRSFASVEVLIHQDLGLNSPPPAVTVTPPPVNVAVPVPAPARDAVTLMVLADQLVNQAGAFVQVFGPTARVVPEGAFILSDAQRLLAAAADFRQNVARGLDANALAYAFRDTDAIWLRLSRRVNRIARGRTGPNIQQVGKLGETCEQIHRALGMPGFAATVGPF